MGASPPSPTNPDSGSSKTNKHHWDTLQRQFGIDDESFDAVIEQGILDIWKVPDYSSKWGFVVNGPCSAQAEELPSGSYRVTFMLKEKKMMRPKDFFLPYHKQAPGQLNYYDGPVENKTEMMTREELQDAMAEPLKNGGAPAGGGMPGGAPPGGAPGGAPPMGGAPGGAPAPGGM